MKKSWVLPLVILAILIMAILIRWETLSSQSNSAVTYKYRLDRWTGQIWVGVYWRGGAVHFIKPDRNVSGYSSIENHSNTPDILGTIWRIATGATAIWLVVAVGRNFKHN